MGQMRMESPDLTSENIERIGAIFPNCVTETADENGRLKKAINFDLLRQMLSADVTSGDEAYEFTWAGKKASIAEANKPTRKTLRPCREESVHWDTTENLYIEGDNLEVIKLLQESYLGAIKVIYIDPPYNTGNDFVYRDNFSIDAHSYAEQLGQVDEERNRLFRNTETNGRFHSDWCSMMYARLHLARNLLKDDGIIFISIDDSEVKNLKNICDEVFGAANFVAQLIWQNKKGGGNDAKHIAIEHEYILVYARSKVLLGEFYERYSEDYCRRYKEVDEQGRYFWDTFRRKAGKQYYPIVCPDGTTIEYDEDGNPISWLRSKARFDSDIEAGEIRIIKIKDKWSVQFKQRMPLGKTPRSIFTTEPVLSDRGTTSAGAGDVYELFRKDVFSNPKPVELIRFLLGFGLEKNDIVLDFFSGSATTAEAVFRSNLDGEKHRFILVQIPENIDPMLTSSSGNAKRVAENAAAVLDELGKTHTITELAKERIRRAGARILENHLPEHGTNNAKNANYYYTNSINSANSANDTNGANSTNDTNEINRANITNSTNNANRADEIDIGFRVFKLDDSNMTDVFYSADEYDQDMLSLMESNVKPDRTDLDLLFGCLLEWGLPLSLRYTSEQIEGCTVHTCNSGDLIACFDENIPESVIKTIAKRQPLRAVFRDSSFASSSAKINIAAIFQLLAPDAGVRVI